MITAFDAAAFQAALTTAQVGRFLVYRPSVDSTMVLARREAAEGAPHGTLVLAEEQTAGRGRKGRSFRSPAGENLYFTLVLRCPAEQHRRLPLAVPLAVLVGVRALLPSAAIKWPNDIWVGERKLAGMLIDAEIEDFGALAFPGIGINVNGDPTVFPELQHIATSISREAGAAVAREPLLAAICNALEESLELPTDDLAPRYRAGSLVLGRPVTVTPAAGEPFSGTAKDITADGSLVVMRDNGATETLNAGEVSLRPGPA